MTQVDGVLALLLPQGMLEKIGATVGDEFDVALENDTLVVRRREELDQNDQIDVILDDLFRERESVYRALAEGAK
ncbi:MAG: hypothetical protein WBO46_08630 [Caldilineaceae bacterium]